MSAKISKQISTFAFLFKCILQDGMFDKTSLMRNLWHRFKVQAMFFQLEHQPWVRISTAIYNTIEDYEKLADAILTLKAEDRDGRVCIQGD